jgi:hypothetical protein
MIVRGKPPLTKVIVVAAVLFMTGSGNVLATGNVGSHHLRDTAGSPGVTCTFVTRGANWVLHTLRVQPPVMKAFNRTNRSDTQKVGWKYQVEFSQNEGTTWHTRFLSNAQKAKATETTAAPFAARTYTLPSGIGPELRVRIKMFWYHPGVTTVNGHVDQLHHWYLLKPPAAVAIASENSCPGVIQGF